MRAGIGLALIALATGAMLLRFPHWFRPALVRLPFDAPLVPRAVQDHYWSERARRAGDPVDGGTCPRFVDVRAESGVTYVNSSPGVEADYLPEMKGGGVLVLDYDGDGWDDLYFPDFSPRGLLGEGEPGRPALYRNAGGWRFEDVTAAAGLLSGEVGYAGAAADLDRDGDLDLVLTQFGAIRTFLNDGAGHFDDVSARSGVAASSFATTAEFFDYDRDGMLDLFVLSYGDWSPEIDASCKRQWQGAMDLSEQGGGSTMRRWVAPGTDEHPSVVGGVVVPACLPENRAYLFRGHGDGTFTDVSERAGLHDKGTRGLGIGVIDLEGDLLPDLLVANDQSPTQLYRNRGDGSFDEIALRAGVAYDHTGNAGSGMGVAAGYLLGDERLCFAIGFYCGEEVPLFCQARGDDGVEPYRFEDLSGTIGPDDGTSTLVTFGVQAVDYDHDGWDDLFLANGHSARDFVIPGTPAKMPCAVFQNLAGERFAEWVRPASEALGRRILGRGMAQADLDHDGDVDLVVSESGGPPMLLRNDTDKGGNHALLFELVGTRSNVEGLGAHVEVSCGAVRKHLYTSARSSFMARSSDLHHVGLGACAGEADLTVRWPSGHVDRFRHLAVDQALRLTENRARAQTLYRF